MKHSFCQGCIQTNCGMCAKLELYYQGSADAIDELVSKVCTTWLFKGNSGKAYRDEIKAIAEQLKEEHSNERMDL